MEINTLKTIFGRYHIRPNKLLGQNFLLSEEVLDEIVRASELTKADTVLEIGPGLGFLTKRLAEKAGKVIAVEKDRKLARILQKIFSTPSSSPPYQPRRNRRGQGGERVGVAPPEAMPEAGGRTGKGGKKNCSIMKYSVRCCKSA